MTKVVAVSATRRTDGGRERVALNIAYVRALTHAGLVPLLVPPVLDPDAACAALDRVQGLVLTGGEDVEPSRYGAPPHPKLGETDAARDAVELALIAGAEGRRLPILAICRGIQILNVALGGTLYQDLASERGSGPIDHADTAARHALRVEPESLLHRTLGTVAAHANSRHHQAIRALAPTLRATAWAADGVVEGVERRPRGAVDAGGPVASGRRHGGRAVPRLCRGHRVSLAFPSPEWVSAYGAAINASEAYRAASLEWTHGAVALVVNAQPEIGITEAVGIWLDLDRGTCREAKVVSQGDAERAAFVIAGDYAQWKRVIRKELGPIAGIMQRKLSLKGSLPIVVRFVKSAEQLVQAATTLSTRFLDE